MREIQLDWPYTGDACQALPFSFLNLSAKKVVRKYCIVFTGFWWFNSSIECHERIPNSYCCLGKICNRTLRGRALIWGTTSRWCVDKENCQHEYGSIATAFEARKIIWSVPCSTLDKLWSPRLPSLSWTYIALKWRYAETHYIHKVIMTCCISHPRPRDHSIPHSVLVFFS